MPQIVGRIAFVHVCHRIPKLKHVRRLGPQRLVPTHPHFSTSNLQLHRAVQRRAHQQLGPPVRRLHVLVKLQDHALAVDLRGPQFGKS